MEKAKETFTVALMLYVVTAVFILVWQLLVRHTFPRAYGYSMLIALALLKGSLISLRSEAGPQQLSADERLKLRALLKGTLLLFFLLLLLSLLFNPTNASIFNK